MSIFDTIKENLDITDIAGRYTQLKRSGRNGRMNGLCPIHADNKNTSFTVFPETHRWHCFGCNRGGALGLGIETLHRAKSAVTT